MKFEDIKMDFTAYANKHIANLPIRKDDKIFTKWHFNECLAKLSQNGTEWSEAIMNLSAEQCSELMDEFKKMLDAHDATASTSIAGAYLEQLSKGKAGPSVTQ